MAVIMFSSAYAWTNQRTDRCDVPEWVTNEAGNRTQKRVWDDLLKRLDSIGHSVDIKALTTK